MEKLLFDAKRYLEENPLGFNKEQKQKLLLDVVSPRNGVVCDEYVEFKLWKRGLKSRQEYFADYVEQRLPAERYPRMLEVGCGRTARLSAMLVKRGYQMTAMDTVLAPEQLAAEEGIVCRREAFCHDTTDISEYDAVIAQEPCEATEHIIRACVKAAKPFIISLCGTPHALIDGEEPETIQEWYTYLSELIGEKGTVQKQELIPGFLCFVAETNREK